MLHGFLPGKLKDRVFRHPVAELWHPGNRYFFLCWLFSAFQILARMKKKVKWLGLQLSVVGRAKIQFSITETIFHQNNKGSAISLWCKRGTDTVQTPRCCSHAEEVKGRERRTVLSPWRKCRHGGSALTLLTRQFLNMRSFWTADLNITALWGRNGSNGAPYSPRLQNISRTHI